LRRFAVEAAREEARSFCEDLVAPQRLPAPHAIPPMMLDERLVA
jgi:hypothetical protein